MSIKVKQHDITDCGATCLASITSHYKLDIPISKIRQYSSTNKRGTNILGLIEAAEKLDFVAKGVKSIDEKNKKIYEPLTKIPLPCIAHVLLKNNLLHFMVIYKVTDKKVEVMDPGIGQMKTYTKEEWMKIWTGNLVLIVPDDDFKTGNEKVSLNSRFWLLLVPHRKSLIQAIVGTMVITILGLSISFYIQKLIDFVLPSGNKNLLNLLSVGIILIFILEAFLNYTKSLLIARSGFLIDIRLLLGYYKHLLKLPQSFFDSMRVGEIISRVNDAIKIRNFINETSIEFIVNFFIILFSLSLMAIYSWKIALIILLMIPIYIFLYVIYNLINKKIERKVMEKAADLEGQLVESLNFVGTIKRMGIHKFMNIKTESKYMQFIDKVFVSIKNSLTVGVATSFVNKIFTVILLWVGAYYVFEQEITTGTLLSLYAIIGYFTSPLASLVTMNKSIQNARIAADRLFQIFDLEQEKVIKDSVILTKETFGNIEIKNLTFRYGSWVDVFENLNLVIPKGKKISIVGNSGSGKSTIAHLLQKIYPLNKGSIKISGIDINQIDIKSLRKEISIVPQKVELFSGNVIENIAIGEFEPNMEKMIELCKQLGITSFIEKLPQGFQTYLGENGAVLSGGQKQRIAIARALYKEPSLVILDEATSSLDSESELIIQNTLKLLLKKGLTILAISHRLSTIKNSDLIYVLDNGKIIQKGNHVELINAEGKYKEMWNKQAN